MKKCCFCKVEITEEKHVNGANDNYLCERCITKAYTLLNGNSKVTESKVIKDNETVKSNLKKYPTIVKKLLDEYVIGQEAAKEIMCVAVYNHIKRLNLIEKYGEVVEKSNILMIGPTGTGKTHIIRSLAKLLDLPLVIADATTFTEAGYVGADVESMLVSLVHESDYDLEKASQGIIFIDEIDKLASSNTSGDKKVVGNEGVQQALLKLVEGKKVTLPMYKKSKTDKEELVLDTSNILFICGGAFPKLYENKQGTLTITDFTSAMNLLDFGKEERVITDQDLIDFGLIPELIGRLPIITFLEELSIDMYIDILTKPKHSLLEQYRLLFKEDGIELIIDENAIKEIARLAAEKKRGARALRTIVESVLQKYMYELPGTQKHSLRVSLDERNQFKYVLN